MNINQVHNSYAQYQPINQVNKQESSASSHSGKSVHADTVSISKEAIEKFSVDKSRFILNTVNHVYSDEQENLATIGSLKVSDPNAPMEKVYNRSRLEQAMYGHEYIGSYVEITMDPAKAMEEGFADYQEFLKRANALVNEMKALDTTNSLDVSISGDGTRSIKYKDSLGGHISNAAIANKEEVQEWVDDNIDKFQGLGDLSRKYTLAKSINDYESATGISRDDFLIKKYSEEKNHINPETVNELNEYTFKMDNYARRSFGTSPISYHAGDQMGKPGYVNGGNAPKPLLPNMNGNYQ